MIIVVNTEISKASNMYNGMSLAEACAQMEIGVNNIMNEMQMEILLAEHAYLYENGHEITYTNEADGSDNANGIKLKDTIKQKVTAARDFIMGIFDKITEWINARIDDVVAAFQKMGLGKKACESARDIYIADITSNGSAAHLGNAVDYKNFISDMNSLFISAVNVGEELKCEVFKKYVSDDKSERPLTANMIDEAISAVFNKDSVLKDVRAAKKGANKSLADIRKMCDKKSDAGSEYIGQINAAIKYNSAVARDCAKVYHAYIADCVAILRNMMRNPAVKKAAAEDFKTAVKAAPGKVAAGAKDFGNNVKNFGKFGKKRII